MQWHWWQPNNDSLRWSGLLHHEGNARWNISVQQIFFNLSKFQPDNVANWGNPPKKLTPAGPRSKWLHPKIFLENPHDFAQTQPWALNEHLQTHCRKPRSLFIRNPSIRDYFGFSVFFFIFLEAVISRYFRLVSFFKKWPYGFFLGRDTYREMAPHTFDTNIY